MSVTEERTSSSDVDRVDNRVRVLTVDDQDYFRGVMGEVIAATEGFTLIGAVASGEEALEAAESRAPSLVVIDKRMAGMDGIEACRRLTERHPRLAVILVSIEDPDPAVAASCGAAGYLRKEDLSPRALRELWRRHASSSS